MWQQESKNIIKDNVSLLLAGSQYHRATTRTRTQSASTEINAGRVVRSALISVRNLLHCLQQWQQVILHSALFYCNKSIYDKDTKKAKGVEILDAETNKTYDFNSKIVFLCASALNSTWVLMNSATDIWPDGLGSSSGELGHNVMDHHFRVGAGGHVEGYEDKYYYGRRPNGIYIPRFRNLDGDKRDYIRGFGYQGGASRQGWRRKWQN